MRIPIAIGSSLVVFLLILGYLPLHSNASFYFTFNSQYGTGADVGIGTTGLYNYPATTIAVDSHGGDGTTTASANAAGTDLTYNAGGGSADSYANAGLQKLGVKASAECSSFCLNQYDGLGMVSTAEGIFYDTYTIQCTTSCNSGIDLKISWSIDGNFSTIINRPDSFVSLSISFSGLSVSTGGVVQGVCFVDPIAGNVYDCPPTVMNADPNAVPLYSGCTTEGIYCPSTTTFSYSGTAKLSDLLNHYGIGIAQGDTYRIIFDMSSHVTTSVPGSSGTVNALNTATISVFSTTPGVTIVSAAEQTTTTSSTTTSSSSTQTTGVPEFPSSAVLLIAFATTIPLILTIRVWTAKSRS